MRSAARQEDELPFTESLLLVSLPDFYLSVDYIEGLVFVVMNVWRWPMLYRFQSPERRSISPNAGRYTGRQEPKMLVRHSLLERQILVLRP
jgi:hypothetical protein